MSAKMSKLAQFTNLLMQTAREQGSPEDVAACQRVISLTAELLVETGAASGSTDTAALECIGSVTGVPRLNTVNYETDVGAAKLFNFVKDCGVPTDMQVQVATEVARIMNGGVTHSSALERPQSNDSHVKISEMVGRGAMPMINHDDKVALEAFGNNIDSLQQDNRLTIMMTVLRSFTSIIDKMLPRVSEESNVVSISVPNPEVYDLATSMNPSSAVRYNQAARQPLISLYANPESVSTQPKRITPLTANDTSTPSAMFDAVNTPFAVRTGAAIDMFDLSYNNVVGYNSFDYTDLVAEGGNINTLYVQAQQTVPGSNGAAATVVTEVYAIPVGPLNQSVFVQSPNSLDSGDYVVNMKTSTMLRKGATTYTNGASAIFVWNDGVVQLDLNFSATLNLKTGMVFGSSGGVIATVKPVGAGNTVPPSQATLTSAGEVVYSIVGWEPNLYFDEENMRKTTTAVRVNYLERQFVIPMGRNFLVDYALGQQDDVNVASTVNQVVSLGNSSRGLSIVQSVMTQIGVANAFAAANPEMASLVSPTKLSFAGPLCLPIVINATLDFSDAKTAVMRESERLSDMHARLRETLLNTLASLNAQNMYLYNLQPGEKVVYKVLAHSAVGDLLFGIKDYHNNLADKVPAANGCDYSFELPNGYRIDLVKTNFTSYTNTIMIIPVREADPKHITSFATIRDRGMFTAQYTPINNGAVARRIVANSREIVMPSNPTGVLLNIQNLNYEVGSFTPALSNL